MFALLEHLELWTCQLSNIYFCHTVRLFARTANCCLRFMSTFVQFLVPLHSASELVIELVIKLKKRLVRASWLVIVRAYQRRPTSVLMRWDMRV